MKITHALVSTTVAAALLAGGALAGSAGVEGNAGGLANAHGEVKSLDADRSSATDARPQDVIVEDGVARVFGGDRYGTAAAIAEAYGWDFTNTGVVYIASGQQLPDALALGPSTFGNGPLLLVKKDSIPGETRRMLEELEPCYIDVVGGTGVVNKQVFNQLKQYAHPEYCEA